MVDIAVVIPSWQPTRALAVARHLFYQEKRQRAHYILVLPDGVPSPESIADPELSEWMDLAEPALTFIRADGYRSPVEAMALAGDHLLSEEESQRGPGHSPSDIFVFLHDDASIDSGGWDQSIIDLFAYDSRCGLAGLGGSPGLGTDDLYRLPYDYRQLARVGGFYSQMRNAEEHGIRLPDSRPRPCAALDGFCLIVTREFYIAAGSREIIEEGQVVSGDGAWQSCLSDGIPFHMYDAWISCRAAALGYQTYLLPLPCHHEGGQTSVRMQAEYDQLVTRLGYDSPQDLYDKAHRVIYNRFRDVLPLRRGEEYYKEPRFL